MLEIVVARFGGFAELCMSSHFIAVAEMQIPEPHSILIQSESLCFRITWKRTVKIQNKNSILKNLSVWTVGEKEKAPQE